MKTLILSLVVLLSGCQFIESGAGKARYRYTVTTPDGTTHEIDLQNAKDIGLVSATVRYGEVEVELIEEGVSASSPMTVMVEQNSRLIEALIGAVP